MTDRNNREIHAGDIVEIRGAYFKTDNGFYYVEQDGTNEAYLDKTGLTLKKIGKRGKISTAKYSLAFYPLKAYCSDRMKSAMADEWNRYHASIEIVDGIDNTEVIGAFEKDKAEHEESIRYYELRGYSESYLEPYRKHLEYIDKTLARLYR